MKKNLLLVAMLIGGYAAIISFGTGCAQISSPTGGLRDSLPPRLVKANPAQNTVQFTGNKASLSFDEYIELQDLQNNLVVSPLPKNTPTISYNLKTISIKFRDSLLPNTTYHVDFGNAVRDIHESNVLKGFSYVFSTGQSIDSLTIKGTVLLAETGKADSTILAMLYRNTDDSAVLKTKPQYIAKVDGSGNFTFNHLPAADFRIYALKDGDGGKTYNSKTELFAFRELPVNPAKNNESIRLFAFEEQKADNKKPAPVLKAPAEKKLKYTTSLTSLVQDLLQPLEISFNNPLKNMDSVNAILTDSNFRKIRAYTTTVDSTRKKITIRTNWQPATDYCFLLPKDAFTDSAGNILTRTDTIRFKTKREEEYGSVLLRFTNIDLSLHPVIQFTETETVKYAYPIVSNEWSNKRFPPGEYGIRILYDLNNNGKWDPGNYSKKIQPEKVTSLDLKLNIKANWDNERDIKL